MNERKDTMELAILELKERDKKIEELQEELDQIKQLYEIDKESWKEQMYELQDRNNKAIEFVSRYEINSIGTPLTYTHFGKELLDILRGDKDE